MKHILTIAAADSSGGAGITRDCMVAHELGLWPHAAITAITTQDFSHVYSIHPVPAKQMADQLRSILSHFDIDHVKIGMLYSTEIVKIVADILSRHNNIHITIDPVIISSGGERLITDDALTIMQEELLPLTDIITPNLPELEQLSGCKASPLNAHDAAHVVAQRYHTAVLVKGGHSDGAIITDKLISSKATYATHHQRRKYSYSHGSGCVLSMALTCYLALGLDYSGALSNAVSYTLNHFDSINGIAKTSGRNLNRDTFLHRD